MLKRLLDILISLVGLIILFPLLLILALIVRIMDHGPSFYRAKRVGKDGKIFTMFKFRSMVVNADKIGGPWTPGDDPRLTKTGKLLRKYKLDELPELVNVLRGDMSIVGPRPEVSFYINLMTQEERNIILSVNPGITDWASLWNYHEEKILHGSPDPDKTYREKIWREKKRLQIKYIEERSFMTDINILIKTAMKFISKK